MSSHPEPKRALVTGASSGIGAAVSRLLAARGIEVWLAARRKELLDAEVERIQAAGGRAHALVLDVSNVDATYERLARLDDEVGGIDLVMANAGIGGPRGALELQDCAWADVKDFIHVNFLGAVATISPFIPKMVARGHGQIVGVSSVAAELPFHRNGPYGSGKAGLTFFLECADIGLRPQGVPVTIIHPGFVETAMTSEITDPKPLIMSEARAARIIDRGIRRRARKVRFPWSLAAFMRLVRVLPRSLTSPVIRAATSERGKTKALPAVS